MVGTSSEYIEKETKFKLMANIFGFIGGFLAGCLFFGAIILMWVQF